MSARHDPRLRGVLREPHDERRARSNWEAIERRRARASVPLASWWPRAAGVLAVAAVIALGLVLARGAGDPELPSSTTPGPLAIAGGPVASGVVDRDALVLEDGSRVEIARGSRLEILENAGDRIRFWLREGSARFDVVPGGPRRWVIESGLVTVEVLGTSFSVEHRAGSVRVEVTRGVVLVRGATVPEGLRRLVAGDAIDVPALASAPTPPEPDQAAPAPEPRASAPVRRTVIASEARAVATARTEPAPTESAATVPAAEPEPTGEPETATGATPETAASETAPPARDPRLREADALRAAGRIDEAIALLDAVASDPEAGRARALAAFTRGRLELDRRGRAYDAARAFERAIELGLREPLLEDARARRVEALARVPDPLAARQAAAEYRAHHPDGRWRDEVDRWSGER